MQAMHGRLSDPGQYQALQHFITHSPWDAQRVWAHLRTVVPLRTGILAIDDTGFRSKDALGGCATAVLWRAGQDRQLPGGGVECVDRRRPHVAIGL